MSNIKKFDPKELETRDVQIGRGITVQEFNYPINRHDHGVATFKRAPWWQMLQAVDGQIFTPAIIPDNVARAFCFEGGEPRKFEDHDINPDMFGIEWEYIAQVGGSMVRPGKPFLSDIEEWYDKVVWPDIEKWDWAGSAAKNNGTFLQPDKFNQMWFQTGWFERLISMLDFENAVMAIFDEDSQEHVHKFFDKLTDLYIRIFDKVVATYPEVHAFFIHDDWGSQKAPFFSPSVAEEMVVPYMRRVTDFLHSKGKLCELHSCGNIYQQVPNMIAAGWDAWAPQLMNDSQKIYDDYGDKILIATFPQGLPDSIEALPEEEQRRYAREYAEKYCRADKPSFYNFYAAKYLTPAFREELYIRSREAYSK
ncbi:MAG: methyltransferase [Oscillospiraceae bacterium]|nr:methyltransferase [Oscillospiraceae bacterium]